MGTTILFLPKSYQTGGLGLFQRCNREGIMEMYLDGDVFMLDCVAEKVALF